MEIDVDYLVIGSGLAGLTYALTLASCRIRSAALLTKKRRTDATQQLRSAGWYRRSTFQKTTRSGTPQTGYAHRLGPGFAVKTQWIFLVHEGPERIRDLISLGAQFNTETDDSGQEVLSLGREGGHSRNRIVHTADYTGWEVRTHALGCR